MKPRVCAVSYLNTTPLVWGLLHGPQRGSLDLQFAIPSRCADLLEAGEVDIGLVPAIELERQRLEAIPGLGIASDGPVRSILLVSKTQPSQIRTLAADSSSRTSVVLARILLQHRFEACPEVRATAPNLHPMLDSADAALIIGDPALALPEDPRAHVTLDLGQLWTEWTGLPMVYAVWAARAGYDWSGAAPVLRDSYLYGRSRMEEIVEREAQSRGLNAALARQYLTHNIHFELDSRYEEGLRRYLQLARTLPEKASVNLLSR